MTDKETWWEKYSLFVSNLVSTFIIVFTLLAFWWSILGGINDNRAAIVRNGESIMRNGEGIIQNGERIMQIGERIIQIDEKIDSFKGSHQREHDLFYELPANTEER